MKKRLRLKKVTLRDLDDPVLDRVAGGATGVTECGNTCPGRCPTPNCTQNTQCTWDGCTLGGGCQGQTGGCQSQGTCATHCQCPTDPGLNTCGFTCAPTCFQLTVCPVLTCN
jgi:hypothetical protein